MRIASAGPRPASPAPTSPRRLRKALVATLTFLLLASASGLAAIVTNTLGAGDRFEALLERVELIVDPPPDRPIEDAVKYIPPSQVPPTPPIPSRSSLWASSPQPTPTVTAAPVKAPVDVDILSALGLDPESV